MSATLTALLFAFILLTTASAASTVPVAAGKTIRTAAGPSAVLPVSLPTGYRYLGWKNESPNQVPQIDVPWFMVTFAHGGTRLLWTVTVVDAEPGVDACRSTSVGHSTVAGKKIYWGPVDTYEPLGNGPKGRHVWRCVNAPGGGVGAIKVDAFDQHGSLPIPVVARMVARASNA